MIQMQKTRFPIQWCASLVAAAFCLIAGCDQDAPVVAEFEPNMVFAYHMGIESDQPMDLAVAQTNHALLDLFGTPDDPKLPAFILEDEEFADLVDMEKLLAAAGPAGAEGRGLYRKHCATCHGVTGNGRGPTAALVDPYPRDYRMGRFKFKSTPIGSKPTKEDMAELIRGGITGTTMVKIPELTEDDIAALVDYVIYLSWRGEVERNLLYEAGELDFFAEEDPDTLYTPALKDSADENDKEIWEDQWDLVQDFVIDVAEGWLEAPDRVRDIPERDPALVPDTTEEVLAALHSTDPSPVKESIARGQELFVSESTSCSKCHGKEGRGDGQTNDYDDWAKEWTKRFGIDPAAIEEHVPFIARGALPVRKAIPRNFEEGAFRGGNSPEKLYQRIALGIEGTPMPAAAVGPPQIWDLVNYVRSLYVPKDESERGGAGASTPEQDTGSSEAGSDATAAYSAAHAPAAS